MKKNWVICFAAVWFILIFFGLTYARPCQHIFITLGTGSVTGVYYPAGDMLSRLINKDRKAHGILCSVESTEGSVYNLESLASGDLDMGIVQSDIQYDAYNGTGEFKTKGPNKNLRTVFSLYPEMFTILARADAGIKGFDDLKGKRMDIGNPGSGQRDTLEMVLQTKGWTLAFFNKTVELKPAEQPIALCKDQVDAIVYTVGHPNKCIMDAARQCNTVLVNIAGPCIDKLVNEHHYNLSLIPAGMYPGTDTDTQTFSVWATLVTTTRIPDDVVFSFVKAVFENFDQLKDAHPALGCLEKKQMVKQGLYAPLHPGAVRYYTQAGLL